MNKADLVSLMANSAGISKAQASKAIDAFLDGTTHALKSGDRVALSNFGVFAVAVRAARTGRNPRTGEEIQIPEKKVVKFKPGKVLNNSIK